LLASLFHIWSVLQFFGCEGRFWLKPPPNTYKVLKDEKEHENRKKDLFFCSHNSHEINLTSCHGLLGVQSEYNLTIGINQNSMEAFHKHMEIQFTFFSQSDEKIWP